jgi:mannose/fructose/sorbose-specific phosphotransferase system IIA component
VHDNGAHQNWLLAWFMTNSSAQIIVAAHGDLACALVRTVELIAGPLPNLQCLALAPAEDLQGFTSRLANSIAPNRPALILVDMPGGTPWNLALAVAAENESVRVVAGVNLPMLLEVALAPQNGDIEKLARLAQESGAGSVKIGFAGSR